MSEHYATWIRVGGSIEGSKLKPLIKAIQESYVSTEWGDAPFQPRTPDDLTAACEGPWLWLCCDQARSGEFPAIEKACRKLGLPYTRFTEGGIGCDADVLDWRPGMKQVLTRIGSNDDCEKILVDAKPVQQALQQLLAGEVATAIDTLQGLTPEVRELPPFLVL